MGSVSSTLYNYCRRKILRYNVQNRAYKFLDKEVLPPAPRHPLPESTVRRVEKQDQSLKHLHEKSEELTEHLKKVYLTSTSTVSGTPSKRPLPKKENEHLKTFMFFEPEKPAPGHITLTQMIEILYKTQNENVFMTPTAIAKEYNLDKNDAKYLVSYYSLFRMEKFEFMNQEKPLESEPEEGDKEKRKALTSSEFQRTPKSIAAK